MDLCCTDSPSATFDGTRYDASKLPNANRIICPCLKALYMNGDLEVDEEGRISFEDSDVALRRFGFRDPFLMALMHGGTAQNLDEHGRLNIFTMEASIVEHPVSSGVLELPTLEGRAARFEEMASFADADGRIYAKQAATIVAYYRAHPHDTNRRFSIPFPCCPKLRCGIPLGFAFLRGFAFLFTFVAMLGTMGRTEATGLLSGFFGLKYLTVDDLRGRLMCCFPPVRGTFTL